jgi:hypothetical protein
MTPEEKTRLIEAAKAFVEEIDDIEIFEEDESLFIECESPEDDGTWVKAWIWIPPAAPEE